MGLQTLMMLVRGDHQLHLDILPGLHAGMPESEAHVMETEQSRRLPMPTLLRNYAGRTTLRIRKAVSASSNSSIAMINVAPFEVALLAVEDADVEVRQWIARHGTYLDYRASRDEPTDRNLEDRLINDPDPFVRACRQENPTVFSAWSTTGWIDYFREATHLERLALMRNPEVGNPHAETLVHTIFDYEDQELDIALSARQECILAFLTNAAAVNRSRQLKVSDFIDGLSMIETREHFSHLWMLISRWPEGTGNLQAAVYRYLGAPDETKAEIYRTCPVPAWKLCILENCHEDDFQTIELGMQDADDQCRELAYTKFNPDRYLARRMAESLLEPSTGSLVLRIPALVHVAANLFSKVTTRQPYRDLQPIDPSPSRICKTSQRV